jgi:hypothetical protein
MVVKIDKNEPNIFPTVDATDVEAKGSGRELDVILITRIEGQAVRVRVKLDQAKARVLANQLGKVLGALAMAKSAYALRRGPPLVEA